MTVTVLFWNSSFCLHKSLKFCSRTLQEDRLLPHHLRISGRQLLCLVSTHWTWEACTLTNWRWSLKMFVKTNLCGIFYASDLVWVDIMPVQERRRVRICWSKSSRIYVKFIIKLSQIQLYFFPTKSKLVILKSLLGLVLVLWPQLPARGLGCAIPPLTGEPNIGDHW